MRTNNRYMQQPQHRYRVFARAVTTLSVIASGVVGFAATSAPTPTSHPVEISVNVDRSGQLRATTQRTILLPVWVRCSTDTVGEIDALLEMRIAGRPRAVRAVRNMAMACGPTKQRYVLAFESRDGFATGTATLHLDVSAGFAEEFSTMHIGPRSVRIR